MWSLRFVSPTREDVVASLSYRGTTRRVSAQPVAQRTAAMAAQSLPSPAALSTHIRRPQLQLLRQCGYQRTSPQRQLLQAACFVCGRVHEYTMTHPATAAGAAATTRRGGG